MAKKIISKVHEVVKEYDAFVSDYGKNILAAKINSLNSPTNVKKLSKPFELFGITLPDEDVAILNTRNNFLHGTSPLDKKPKLTDQEELSNIVNKLLFLLMILMLKHAGYSGHIIHYPDWVKYRYKSPYIGRLFFTI